MSRVLKEGWLQAYRRYVFKQESPDLFHFWTAMTMISSALRRHVWIDRKAYTIFPNLYVFLVEESAAARKSTAMELGLSLLSTVATSIKNIRIVHERMTVEGLMDAMKKSEVTPAGVVRMDGSITIHADELSNLFGKSTYVSDLISFLTAAYTGRAKLEFLTRNKGYTQVENVCPVLLAGTTPEMMGEIFPSLTLSSGFFGRVMIVVAKRGKKVSEPELVTELREPLIQDLNRIGYLEGVVKLTDEANEAFNYWYNNVLVGTPSRQTASFYHRKHDHTLKVAMLLSISESDDLIITKKHFEQAKDAVDFLEAQIPEAVKHIGSTDKANLGDLIVSIIAKNGPEPINRTKLLRSIYHRIQDADEFDKIIDTLRETKKIDMLAEGSVILYKLFTKGKKDV